jgi:hypothetical protein
MKKIGLLILLLIAANAGGSAIQAGAIFLTIFPGTRASGMGGAFSSVADDWTAPYYNPGAIAFLTRFQAGHMWAPWLRALATDMNYYNSGVVVPRGDGHTFAANFTYLTLGKIIAIDPGGIEVGRFKPYDYAVSLSYAFRTRLFGFGASLKLIHSFLAPGDIIREVLGEPGGGGSATSAALDLGILFRAPVGFNYSLVLANLGPGLKYTESGGTDPLPYTLRFGVSMDFFRLFRAINPRIPNATSFTLAFEVNKVLNGVREDLRELGFDYVWREAWKSWGMELTLRPLVMLSRYIQHDERWDTENFLTISFRAGYFEDFYGMRKGQTRGLGVRFFFLEYEYANDSQIYVFQTVNHRHSVTLNLPTLF